MYLELRQALKNDKSNHPQQNDKYFKYFVLIITLLA
jgi:hypothetical protein